MVKLKKNRELFLDEVCEGKGNITINIIGINKGVFLERDV